MIFGKTKLELKVGFFVFIGLSILVTFILLIGDFKTWTSGYRINFLFNFVNGVKVGAPVRFAGVDVGEVQRLKFISKANVPTKVLVTGWIKEQTSIPVDSTVWVNTLGLLGEKYIEIIPGRDSANLLKADQTIQGIDPIPMQEVTVLAKSIADNIDKTFAKIHHKEGTLGKLIYDDAIYNELEALVTDIRKHPWKLFMKGKEKPEKK